MAIAIVIALLYLARAVLIPVSLAVLLTFLLAPVVARLQRLIRSRLLAVGCVTCAAIAVAGTGAFIVGQEFVSLASQLPGYHDTIARKVRSIRESTHGVVSDAAKTLQTIGDGFANPPSAGEPGTQLVQERSSDREPPRQEAGPPSSTSAAAPAAPGADGFSALIAVVRPLVSPLATAVVVVLLLAMMLHSCESIRDRVIRLAGLRQISLTTQALEETGARVGRYLRAQSLINLIYGAVVYLGLTLLGIPDAAVCGVIAGFLRFVPIIGVWLGAAIPAALAVAVFDGWWHLAMVISLIAGLELLVSFLLEPWLYGASTGISSFGVVVAIVFWTALWGPVGLVLAMPITVCVMVFARQLPSLSLVPILFGDEPVLTDSARFYQRLLSGNEDDAASVLRAPQGAARQDTSAGPTLARLDEVVITALATARQESLKGTISEELAIQVAQRARDVALDWIGETTPTDTTGQTLRRGPVVCLSVNDTIDECAAAVTAACLESRGVTSLVPSATLLLSEMLGDVRTAEGPVVLLSAVVPASRVHTRRVCKAVRRAVPGAKVVACMWNDPKPAAGSENASSADIDVTTLEDAIDAAMRLAWTPPVRPDRA